MEMSIYVAGKRGGLERGEREPGIGPLAESGGAPEENIPAQAWAGGGVGRSAGGLGPLLPVNLVLFSADCPRDS